MKRCSAVLMPMSSLPSPYGIGGLGKSAYEFIDFLKAAGQSYWQLLPIGPTSYGDSPYSSFSTFAGNPYFIDLEDLLEQGLLTEADLEGIDWGSQPDHVDYGCVYNSRFKVLRLAFSRGRERLEKELEDFRRENESWLEDYALYMAVKAEFGMSSWTQWPDEAIRRHQQPALEAYRRKLSPEVDFYVFMQYLFYSQWKKLRAYAQEQGIGFIGDIPIYVAMDSADVWAEPEFFQLDEDNMPKQVAGVPPDAFTADGQLWGNPLYDWDRMERDGFGWWIRRIDGAKNLYDLIRIDHFRGLESYWSVPYGASTAKKGQWKKGPGMKLVGVLTSWFHDLGFIAEDLGYVTPEVKDLLDRSGLPGMKVMQFAFDAHGESDYLPHRCEKNSVCYIGTHDNDTIEGWLSTMSQEDKDFAKRYMHITEDEGWCWGMIRSGMATASDLFVVQMQDLLQLPGDCRMNLPGSSRGNWQWRMLPDALTEELAKKLRLYTETFRRCWPETVKDTDEDEGKLEESCKLSTK